MTRASAARYEYHAAYRGNSNNRQICCGRTMLVRQQHEVVIANLGPYTRCEIRHMRTSHLSLPLTLTFFNTRPRGTSFVEFGSRPLAFCSSCRQDIWIFILRGYHASRCLMICRAMSIDKPKAGFPSGELPRAAVIFSAILSPGQRSSYIVAFLLVTSSILYASARQQHMKFALGSRGAVSNKIMTYVFASHASSPSGNPYHLLTSWLNNLLPKRRDPPSFCKANDRHPWNGILTSMMTWEKYEKLTLCYEGYISDRWHFRNGHRFRI